MKLKIPFFILIFWAATLAGQPIIVTGSLYHPLNKTQQLQISDELRDPVYDTFHHVFVFKPVNNLQFNSSFTATKPKLYQVDYGGLASNIYLSPGDSISINYSRLKIPDTIRTSNGYETVTTKIIISGTHSYQYNFFDSLQSNTSRLNGNTIRMDYSQHEWETIYRDSVEARNKKRIQYWHSYSLKHALSQTFDSLIATAIEAIHLDELMQAIYHEGRNFFPPEYFLPVDTFHFRWSDYKKSNLYATLLYVYVNHYLNWENITGLHTSNGSFANIYENILSHITDDSIRNYTLTYLMSQWLEKTPPQYQEYFERYKKDCSNKIYVQEVNKLYNQFLVKYERNNIPEKLLGAASLEDINRQYTSLKKLLTAHKPLLLDFWASWCGPCLMEMPDAKIFENYYKEKVDFVYISIDADSLLWKNAVKKYKLTGAQYLLLKERKSNLAKFLKLTYVPRFVLIKGDGKILIFKAPTPATKSNFKKMLDSIE